MEIRSVGAELLRPDGQTDRLEETNSRFCNFGNAKKNQSYVTRR